MPTSFTYICLLFYYFRKRNKVINIIIAKIKETTINLPQKSKEFFLVKHFNVSSLRLNH